MAIAGIGVFVLRVLLRVAGAGAGFVLQVLLPCCCWYNDPKVHLENRSLRVLSESFQWIVKHIQTVSPSKLIQCSFLHTKNKELPVWPGWDF